MRPKIQIFDVDGTLTTSEKDVPCNYSVQATYSYWPALSRQLAHNPVQFSHEVAQWEAGMAKIQDSNQKDQSSFEMMDKTVRELLFKRVTAEEMSNCAKQMTHNFLIHNIVHLPAIRYISECLDKNIICFLTTGSYLDGLKGFVAALIERKLLKPSRNLLLNGAVVDWKNKKLTKANVGQYKTDNFWQTLAEENIENPIIQAAFGDDPYINDKAILELPYEVPPPHGEAYVIKCQKNLRGGFDRRFVHCTWDEFFSTYQGKVLSCQ